MDVPFWKVGGVSPARLSEAIVKHLGLMWTAEAEGEITAMVGEEGLKKVKEIDGFANRQELWMESGAYERVKKLVGETYPELTGEAVTVVASRAAWSWR